MMEHPSLQGEFLKAHVATEDDLVEGRVADGPTALLIRPDGYVAWASSDREPDVETLRSALTRWFGAAT
jgi:hypothetical protein